MVHSLINSRISVLERIQTVAGSRPTFELVDLCDAVHIIIIIIIIFVLLYDEWMSFC